MFYQKLKIVQFCFTFDERLKIIQDQLLNVNLGIDIVFNSKEFKMILASALTIGNKLNAGKNKYQQADGFLFKELAKTFSIEDKNKVCIFNMTYQLLKDSDQKEYKVDWTKMCKQWSEFSTIKKIMLEPDVTEKYRSLSSDFNKNYKAFSAL